jgi:hypothetical protein
VPDITDEEYEKILNRVKAGDFENVILMSEFPSDEIMRSVPERYFFVKNIGLYMIYSKYNAEGYSIEYNFTENLGQALQRYSLEDGTGGNLIELNESIYLTVVQRITINGDSRVAIMQQTIAPWDSHTVDSDLVYSNVAVSLGSKLNFSVAMHPDAWNKTDGVIFKVLVQNETGVHEIFSRYVNPPENIEDRNWLDYSVDLNEFAGESISFHFVTNPGPNRSNAYDWANWGNPLMVKK